LAPQVTLSIHAPYSTSVGNGVHARLSINALVVAVLVVAVLVVAVLVVAVLVVAVLVVAVLVVAVLVVGLSEVAQQCAAGRGPAATLRVRR